jgi:hypothetical protein
MSLESNDYQNCKITQPDMTVRKWLDGTPEDEVPANPTPLEVLYYRKKPLLVKRDRQIAINQLGLEGGRPYVNARLSRFAAESNIDWCGGTRPDGGVATGRLQQTHAFPYLGRINDKINQYVFADDPEREGADVHVLKDITRDGKSLNSVMREVSGYLLSSKWCWIGIDAPTRKEDGTEYTIAEKEALKIRPYWQVYDPKDVLDWHFSEQGELEWVKTQHIEYDDSDPAAVPSPSRVVRLWEKGRVTELRLLKGLLRGRKRVKAEVFDTSLGKVPFILVGEPSEKPIAFDDLESINRTIMDLGSVDRANFYNTSYPQLILPASVLTNAVNSGYASSPTEAGKMVTGFKSPILVDEGDVTPSYLMPDAQSMRTVGDRITTLKRELFEVVGLALESDSKQVESAEAKAWDALDVSAVMKARAEILEDAERKAVAICAEWDKSFQTWEPKYNQDFDIGNFKEEVEALIMAGNMPAPASVTREVVRKLIDRLDRIGAPIDDETKTKMIEELDNWEPDSFSGLSPAV